MQKEGRLAISQKQEREDEYDDSGEEENDAERDMLRENNHEAVLGQRGASGAAHIKKLTGAILAKAFLPTTVEVKQCLVYIDLAIKMQMIVFDFSSSLWWSSMAEFLIFFPFGLFVFFLDAGRMGSIWLFIPHLVRGVLGLLIIKKMPTTHDMVSKIDIPPNENIPFS